MAVEDNFNLLGLQANIENELEDNNVASVVGNEDSNVGNDDNNVDSVVGNDDNNVDSNVGNDDNNIGNDGNDYIDAVTGDKPKSRDRVKCGDGRDTVFARKRDRVADDCERVKGPGAVQPFD